jgi:predicted CXXCH cytochrome family protein
VKIVVPALAAALLLGSPLTARAYGAHDAVGCAGCHSVHNAKGDEIFAVAPNKTYVNPATKQPYSGSTALCFGCHQEPDKGGQGMGPISAHTSHPLSVPSVNTRVAKVPPELLRDGAKFECLACHDPHPSNPYYKYLRVDTAGGKNMDKFCAVCHAMKADVALASEKAPLFTSMDETGNRVLAPASTPASPKPAKATRKKP